MSNVIPIHVTRAAKERGVMAAAGIRGMAEGLSPIQCEALMRFARDQYRRCHASPAVAVANASARARLLGKEMRA